MPKKSSKKSMQVKGVVEIMLGLLIFIWARSHSPNMGFGEMLTKANSYILKEPAYYTYLIIAGLGAMAGVINLVKSFQTDGKNDNNLGSIGSGVSPALEQIRKAKELLDAGAIDTAEFEKIKKQALDR